MDYSNFGTTAFGAGGGGGFVSSSQATPGSASKTRGTNTLRPVTLKQVLEATQPHPDAEFRIDDAELNQITFVAQIRNISEQTTNITYKVDDGTGTIEVKQWVDADTITNEFNPQRLTENEYVRVLGQLKSFNNKRHVGAHQVRPVKDFNEVQYHLLEATAIHLHFLHGPPEQFLSRGGDSGIGMNKGEDVTMGGMGAAGGGGGGGGMGRGLPHMVGDVKRVYDTLRSIPKTNSGVHVNEIVNRSGLPMKVVSEAVGELLESGAAYTTLGDDYIAIMDF